MDIIDIFNSKLKEFLKDVVPLCPDLEDARKALNLALVVDSSIAQVYFDKYVAQKYTTQILNKDESFFMSKTYDNEDIAIDFDFIDKIKKVWKQLSVENKEAVWKYMQVLILLNSKYTKQQV